MSRSVSIVLLLVVVGLQQVTLISGNLHLRPLQGVDVNSRFALPAKKLLVQQQQQQQQLLSKTNSVERRCTSTLQTSSLIVVLNSLRGGSDSEEEDDDIDDDDIDDDDIDDDDIDDDDDNTSQVDFTSGAVSIVMDVLKLIGKATLATSKALSRSLNAALDTPTPTDLANDNNEETTIISKVINIVQRMWKAACNADDGDDDNSEATTTTTTKIRKSKTELQEMEVVEEDSHSDFGTFLSHQYGVTDDRNEKVLIRTGSISNALKEARSQARLLVAFIPATSSSQATSSSTTSAPSPDQLAIRSLLSAEVSKVTEKKSRKSAPHNNNNNTGSFLLWSAPASSPDAMMAMKLLQVTTTTSGSSKKKKNEPRPILVVAYPAQVMSPTTGVVKMRPKVLAQHHCSPPPSSESMALWLNVLRKRHAKQYAIMHHEQKELQLFRERQEGYKSSIQSDVQRRKQAEQEEAERMAKEVAEQERLDGLRQRRIALKASLPEEPPPTTSKKTSSSSSSDTTTTTTTTTVDDDDDDVVVVMTIALRFADGRTGQRRFLSSTELKTVFNWADAMYGVERERITLITMNGQTRFDWNDDDERTLAETGLGRMTGLRVLEKSMSKDDDDDDKNTTNTNDDNSSSKNKADTESNDDDDDEDDEDDDDDDE